MAQEKRAAAGIKVKAPNPLDKRFDIDFPGGTMVEFLDLIGEKIKSKPNVIVSKEASTMSDIPQPKERTSSLDIVD